MHFSGASEEEVQRSFSGSFCFGRCDRVIRANVAQIVPCYDKQGRAYLVHKRCVISYLQLNELVAMNEPAVKALADCFVQTLSPDPVQCASMLCWHGVASGRRVELSFAHAPTAGQDQGSRGLSGKRFCATAAWHKCAEGKMKVHGVGQSILRCPSQHVHHRPAILLNCNMSIQLIASEAPVEVRQAAAVNFKNFVKPRWVKSCSWLFYKYS